ncbi:hypothetical protein BEK98_40330 [Streptomyces diastatochromogenes]|uniref:Uncharacterized protein n=1 Tax=Streptomyces diastatochromogenes TaxID=42236 RepID=A0A233RZS7_STRDA|nr:hypothetical protein [Streptomyces diastatochromogenes]OXY88905.1 hypothetical protein BEK98_40330 [Streptomyces diastatochromogenes]
MLAPAAQASGYGGSGNLIDKFPVTYSGSTFGNVYLDQAGPVSISAAGHCILIYGRIGWAGNTGGAFDIGHCG